MRNDNLYYKESGYVGIPGLALMTIAGLTTSILFGFIYAYAIFYIPFIYLNFFITLIFGAGIGLAVGKSGFLTKVRNKNVMLLFGLIFGLLAEYFGWVFWIYAASEQQLLSFNPSTVIYTMQGVAEFGAWSIFGWTPTGSALYIIWLIEGVMIVGAAVGTTLMGIGSNPFCEKCQRWTETTVLASYLEPIVNLPEFVDALENKRLEVLTNLANLKSSGDNRTRVELASCESCDNAHYLTLKEVRTNINDKGEPEVEENVLVENLVIDPATLDELKTWAKSLS